jgi:hypothetical protein
VLNVKALLTEFTDFQGIILVSRGVNALFGMSLETIAFGRANRGLSGFAKNG